VFEPARTLPRKNVPIRIGTEHGELRLGFQQQTQLRDRSLARAGDDDPLPGKAEEDGKVLHRFDPLPNSLILEL